MCNFVLLRLTQLMEKWCYKEALLDHYFEQPSIRKVLKTDFNIYPLAFINSTSHFPLFGIKYGQTYMIVQSV